MTGILTRRNADRPATVVASAGLLTGCDRLSNKPEVSRRCSKRVRAPITGCNVCCRIAPRSPANIAPNQRSPIFRANGTRMPQGGGLCPARRQRLRRLDGGDRRTCSAPNADRARPIAPDAQPQPDYAARLRRRLVGDRQMDRRPPQIPARPAPAFCRRRTISCSGAPTRSGRRRSPIMKASTASTQRILRRSSPTLSTMEPIPGARTARRCECGSSASSATSMPNTSSASKPSPS